ncbi:MAG: response regulator [Thermoplasmata archaeon]|nr:response regulator [Thermoplasmata archaeon]NIS19990.1 response regulator [Thermoplasmata archaeon]NIU49097.1 response regulator [Thermoplasmata archaeon]NIV78751.1 response regulator [Thermoplasmata archaeon]NIW82581.1 response regulator [Thermoplasmata archaeon]
MTDERKTILVVEDEPDSADYLAAVLQDNGYATVTAKDGAEALDYLERDAPDLVTLDITMPEKSGVAVYRKLREDDRLKGVPVVIVTGISDDFERFISSRKKVPPPDGYVRKPVDHDDFLAVVDRLVR